MRPKTQTLVLLSLLLVIMTSVSPAQPSVSGYNVYYGDFHNHCNVSDGSGTIDDAYNYARNVSHLDFFSLADHANLISSSEWTQIKNTANAYNEDGVFTAFYGFEWTTYLMYGHVTVVNSDDYCSNSGSTSNFTGLLDWLNSRNCIAFFNHPGWEFFTWNEFNEFTDVPSPKFVGMELWNTTDGFDTYYYNDGYYSGDGNKGYYDEALIRGWKIGAAGGDDNHSANWGNATPWRTGVLAPAKTRNDILNAYQSKRIFSTLDKTLVLSLEINGFIMGSTMLGGAWNAVINAFDIDNEVFNQVQLLKNGVVIYSATPNSTHPVITVPVNCANGDYIYARVKQVDGDEAISSPVFISGIAQPPVVSITNPLNGSSFYQGSDIIIHASASDIDGNVTRVEFYRDGILMGHDSIAPYAFVWTGATIGSHILQAKAFDNYGLSTLSSPITISVEEPPFLLVNPVLQQVTYAPATVTFDVNSNILWTASSDQSWCSVTSGGSGNGQITVVCDENPLSPDRAAEITISGSGVQPVIVRIEQDGHPDRVLNLKMFLQGLYAGNEAMNPALDENSFPRWGVGIADKVTIELHDAGNYFTIVHSATNIDLHTDGTASLLIPASISGSYYLTIRHRNSLETVSMLPVTLSGDVISYDFTTAGNMAYGSNMRLMPDGIWVIYGGDVNQDGIIDAGDMIGVDNDSFIFATGYLVTDCSGDGLIDLSDMMIVENNGRLFIVAVTPD